MDIEALKANKARLERELANPNAQTYAAQEYMKARIKEADAEIAQAAKALADAQAVKRDK